VILLWNFEKKKTASAVGSPKDVPALKRRERTDEIMTLVEKAVQGGSKRNLSFFSEQVDSYSHREY
jgi:hypothetical protein